MTAAGALPPSVEALNRLLGERSGSDRRLPVALGLSYAGHAALASLLFVGFGGRQAREYAANAGGGGIGPMMTVEGVELRGGTAAPVARAAPRPVAPPPAPAPPPAADPDAVRLRPEPRRFPPAPARPAATRSAPAAPTPAEGGSAPAASLGLDPGASRDGSAFGALAGAPGGGGGLGRLAFGNRWYVQRVQDLVLMNWGNPFSGRDRPTAALEVTVFFRILRDGRITQARIEHSSGDADWDRAGLRAVENTVRLPPLPADYPDPDVAVHYRFLSDSLP